MKSKTFGEVVLEARKTRGWTQKTLANKLGVTNTYVSKIEKDNIDYPPSEMFLQKLAFHLALSESKLKQISGWISKKDERLFAELVCRYPNFLTLLKRMKKEPEFARQIFDLLENAK